MVTRAGAPSRVEGLVAMRVVLAMWVVLAMLAIGGGALGQPRVDAAEPAMPPTAAVETAPLPSDDDWLQDASGRARLFDRVAARLEEVYWDPDLIAWDRWKDRYRDEVADAASRPAFDSVMRRAFDGLEDEHSRWIGRPTLRPAPPTATPGPPVDLGVEALPLDGQGLLILRAHPGSAAEVAGLRRGDVVTRAGEAGLDENGLGWTMQSRIAEALRGGTADLTVHRPGVGDVRVRVEPRAVPAGARERPSWSIDPASRIARIDVPSFGSGSAEAVHEAVAEATEAGAVGLIVDLRGNPGGSVVELGLMLSLVAEGTLMESWRADGPDWRLDVEAGDGRAEARLVRVSGPWAGSDVSSARLDDATRWDGPLAVLIDGRSASAAEAAAASLVRDAGAVSVGRPTAGNVESVRRIAFPGGNQAWVAVGELRFPGGEVLAPVPVDVVADLDPVALARGFDAPLAEATRALLGLPITPGRWF